MNHHLASATEMGAVEHPLCAFAAALWHPTDRIELRRITPPPPDSPDAKPKIVQSWINAGEVASEATVAMLTAENGGGANIYAIINPLQRDRGKDEDVKEARSFFVDFDGGATPEEARRRVAAAGLPPFSVIVASGHGCHGYWLLEEPMTDLGEWRRTQKGLIALLGSDKAIHNPSRVMRLPGFLNTKELPHVPCQLVGVHSDRRYSLVTFSHLASARQVQGTATEVYRGSKKGQFPKSLKCPILGAFVPKGERNSALTSRAGSLRRAGLDQDQITVDLLALNREKCSPPLSGKEVRAIAQSVAKYPTAPACPYAQTHSGIVWHKPTSEGPTPVLLAHFNARILTEIVEDDGFEQVRKFEMQASLPGSAPCLFTLTAEKFALMSWPLVHVGVGAVITPGHSAEARTRAAIQLLSGKPQQRHIYGHTGWREINGDWMYLHGGGAIGKNGLDTSVQVSLEGGLARYILPAPPSADKLAEPVRAVLRLLKLGPASIMYPLVAAVFQAVRGGTDFSIFLVGRTNTFKSEVAALIQRFFGLRMDARNLPGNWSSTANALEDSAARSKDTIYVIDDFKPTGDTYLDNKLHAAADRLFRGLGNGSGRQRMAADGTLRNPRPPRCLILATGEDLPRGESLRTRMLISELEPGTIKAAALKQCQEDAARGEYSLFLAAFCQWLARNYENLKRRFQDRSIELRSKFAGQYARQPALLADLLASFEMGMEFICDVTGEEYVTAAQLYELIESAEAAITDAGRAQLVHHQASDPVDRYLDLLRAALASGRAHLTNSAGAEPENSLAFGWSPYSEGSSIGRRPRGIQIGWVEEQNVYLQPDTAYKTAQDHACGHSIPIAERSLRRRLYQRHLLKTTEPDRDTLTIRKMLSGKRETVLHLEAQVLAPHDGEEGLK